MIDMRCRRYRTAVRDRNSVTAGYGARTCRLGCLGSAGPGEFSAPARESRLPGQCAKSLPAWRRLLRAIHGKGAFRRFKDELHEEYPDLLAAWYAFRDARAQRRAVQWLADNSLIDDDAASFLASHPDPDLP
jgi:hypothetical protein